MTALLAMMTVVLAQPGVDRIIGLLALPGVFGEAPCDRFEPRAITIYGDAGATRVLGTIEVDQQWSFAPHGGCEGLEVSVHEGGKRSDLPTREFDYEAPGALVLERRAEAYKIRLSGNRSAWVRSAASGDFMPLEELYEEFTGLTFFTDAFNGELRGAPGPAAANKVISQAKPGQPVRVTETRRVGDRLWLHVEVYTHSLCDAATMGPPESIARGWLLAHANSGEPAIWFASRGC